MLSEIQEIFANPSVRNKRVRTNKRTFRLPSTGGRPRLYPWEELQVGETFSVYKTTGNPASVARNLAGMSNKYGRNFVIADYDSRRIVVKRESLSR